jgi:hypothetical protein
MPPRKPATEPTDSLADLLGSGPSMDSLGADIDLGADLDMDALLNGPAEVLDPLQDTDYPGTLEGDALAEWQELQAHLQHRGEVKADLQQQDKNQRMQFKNIYDSEFWHADAYKSREDKEKALRIQARVLGLDYDRAGNKYRNGYEITRAMIKLAKRLGIDISDLI